MSKTALFVFLGSFSLFLVSCSGSSGESNSPRESNEGGSSIGEKINVEQVDKFSCTQQFNYNGETDPLRATVAQACLDLRGLQESVELTNVEVVDQTEFSASAKVNAILLACQRSCVSEVEKSYDLYVDMNKRWATKSSYSDFSETQGSKEKRYADLAEDLASGISFGVYTDSTPLLFAFEIKVPISIEAERLSDQQSWAWPELDVVFPDGKETTFWVVGGVSKYFGPGEQEVVFYEKTQPGTPLVALDYAEGDILKIVCLRLAYQIPGIPVQIKTDCLPPITK